MKPSMKYSSVRHTDASLGPAVENDMSFTEYIESYQIICFKNEIASAAKNWIKISTDKFNLHPVSCLSFPFLISVFRSFIRFFFNPFFRLIRVIKDYFRLQHSALEMDESKSGAQV